MGYTVSLLVRNLFDFGSGRVSEFSFGGGPMDVSELIAKLSVERQEIDRAIHTLERLAVVRSSRRRGRRQREMPKDGTPPRLPNPPARTHLH